jgi:hypothetical protein
MQTDALTDITDVHHRELISDNEKFGALTFARVDTQRTWAPRYHQAQISVFGGIGIDQLLDGPGYLPCIIGQLEGDRLRRLLQPLQTSLEHKSLAMVKAQAFENAVAVEQAMVENRDCGVARRND